MADFLELVFRALMVGLVMGTIYGLIGIGIVLIYRAQRIINFAQAEIATVAAFMLYLFHSIVGLQYGFSFVLAVLAAVLASVIIERFVIRPLRDSPPVTVFVATAGVALFIIAMTFVIAGGNPFVVHPMFGGVEAALRERPILALVSPQRLLVLGVLVSAAIGLGTFFSRSAFGKAILAMSTEPFAVRLAGVSVSKMSMFIWALAGLLAGLAGVTFMPTGTLTPGWFTGNALIPAFTAIVIGGLTSLPGAFVGGLIVGFVTELAASFVPATVPTPATLASFILLLLTLLLRPQGLLTPREA